MSRRLANASPVQLFLLLLSMAVTAAGQPAARPPNFVVIFTDDQGWGDLGVYGSPDIRTPNIDRMAAEGLRFTSFYAAPVCGPSRAALMTGSYAPRVNLSFNHGPRHSTGIHADEVTIAELLQGRGYATMAIGKWHLGDRPQFLPHRNGFDDWFGLPYSNDMWPYSPRMPPRPNEDERMRAARARAAYTGLAEYETRDQETIARAYSRPLPLHSNDQVLETNPDQTKLTTLYTEKAVEFIGRNQDHSFFLYLAHAMPHVPLHVSAKHAGRSIRGLYGDVIEELDWSVGEILDALKRAGIDDRTLVVFTSDNGPSVQPGIDGGSAGPFRGGKATTWEGGMRVPAIFRWPGEISAGRVTSEVAANLDLLPTFARLAGAALPQDRVLDGRDLWPLLSGQPGARSPHEFFYYFGANMPDTPPDLRAVRGGMWKLIVERSSERWVGKELYDLGSDPGERFDRLEDHPDVAARLEQEANRFYGELLESRRPLGRS